MARGICLSRYKSFAHVSVRVTPEHGPPPEIFREARQRSRDKIGK